MSEDFVSALYRETEGNPFFIEEVIKSLIEQGQIYREQDRWGRKETHELAIPQSVKEAIGRRLTRLSEPTVDALRTAAALGKIFPFRELAAVSHGDARTRCSMRSTKRARRSSSARMPARRAHRPAATTASPSPTTRFARCCTRS